MRRFAPFLILLLAAGASADEFSALEDFRIQAVAEARRQAAVPRFVRGIDVSRRDGEIDWSRVAGAGLSFAYVKATQGSSFVDGRFAANWKGAARAGLARGAYHYYSFCRGGSVQAARFIRTVPTDAGALPAMVDIEESPGCGKIPSRAAFRRQLDVFAAKIRRAYGRPPILYVNRWIYERYFKGEAVPFKFWVAAPGRGASAASIDADWTIWQYGWRGRVDGIAGDGVNLDLFNGTPRMLAEFVGSGPLGLERSGP